MEGFILNSFQIEMYAHRILDQHGLNSIPVDPAIIAKTKGFKVNDAKFADEKLSGMVKNEERYGMGPIDNITIFVNQSYSPFRKRFTIAHELGHLFLHIQRAKEFVDYETDIFRTLDAAGDSAHDSEEIEAQANHFATALLMDANLVEEKWMETHSVETLASLFNVSEEVMSYRIDYLKLR